MSRGRTGARSKRSGAAKTAAPHRAPHHPAKKATHPKPAVPVAKVHKRTATKAHKPPTVKAHQAKVKAAKPGKLKKVSRRF